MEKKQSSKQKLIYNIDVLQKLGTSYSIHGWTIGDSAVKIKVFDKSHQIIDAQINRIARRDVNQVYGLEEDEQSGFLIFIDEKKCHTDELLVAFKSQNGQKVYHVKLSKFKDGEAITGNIRNLISTDNIMKTVHYLKTYGIKSTTDKIKRRFFGKKQYDVWAKKQIVSKNILEEQRKVRFDIQPKISIVIPLYNTPEQYLEEVIESVIGQSYGHWQLCLADASTKTDVEKYIQKHYAKENRIVYQKLERNAGISENTNAALKLADGDFIMFSDHDDIIAENALYEIVRKINEYPDAELIYTDEDKVTMDGKNILNLILNRILI